MRYDGYVGQSPADVSTAAAAQLIQDLRAVLDVKPWASVVFSTGATPVQTYRILREQYREQVAWPRVRVFQLDEYVGLHADDSRRFSTFLRHQLIVPLGAASRLLSGDESDVQMLAYEQEIREAGGLDLVLYGVGVNGHLGFNEPGSAFDVASRRVRLDASTVERIETRTGAAPTEAVTLGLGILNAARRIRVMALGPNKRDALQRGLLEAPTTEVPLSSLQTLHDVQFFIDTQACPLRLDLGTGGATCARDRP